MLALAMAPLCGLPDDFGRGVHRTLTDNDDILCGMMPVVVVVVAASKDSYPDGKAEDVKAKAAQVLYFPALDHLPENLSDTPFEVIGIELKS
jgi:hypothetical protein